MLPGELAKHAVSEGTKAHAKFLESGTPTNRAVHAGLVIDVVAVASMVAKLRPSDRSGDGAVIVIAAVLEYIAVDLLELSGNNAAHTNHRSVVIRKDIEAAIVSDDELVELMKNAAESFCQHEHPAQS